VGEEPAFVAAILAEPRDDAVRLVYADWLEERGDPRGAFLRAEVRAARAGGAAELTALRSLAERVGLSWALTVTRPPLGIAAAVRWERRVRLPSAAEVAEVERRLGGPLPADYRAFALAVNGGDPTPNRFSLPWECPYNGTFSTLHSLNYLRTLDYAVSTWPRDCDDAPPPEYYQHLVDLGPAGNCGDRVALAIRSHEGGRPGEVWYVHLWEGIGVANRLADSFAEFLGLLREESASDRLGRGW
jgi:uncharacterized protein (TIGR02996 family)